MTFHFSVDNPSFHSTRAARGRENGSANALQNAGVAHERGKLSGRLRRVLTERPRARHFTVNRIINALGSESVGPSLALFSAAGVFSVPDTGALSGFITAALGAGLANGRRMVALPRVLLRRKIPRNTLALLIHGISTLLEGAEGVVQQRWSWVFHPAMSVVLGLTLFLLGVVSMTPVIGSGAQYAASAFLVAIGLAERDGLAVMIGAVAGLASIAVAALSIASGKKLWTKVKEWLLQSARKLRLDAFSIFLDRCCDGLGKLVSLGWSGLLLVMLSPVTTPPPRRRGEGLNEPALRTRARRARMAAHRAHLTRLARENGS